jgi:hypothetical protein
MVENICGAQEVDGAGEDSKERVMKDRSFITQKDGYLSRYRQTRIPRIAIH